MNVLDCFIMTGDGVEPDLLEIRLAELDRVVDWFVIAEADKTFQGEHRELTRTHTQPRYAEWQHKIIYLPVHIVADKGCDPWYRESALRNSLTGILDDFEDADRCMVSDLDEIPRAEIVSDWARSTRIVALGARLYYYWLNCRCTFYPDYRARIAPVKIARKYGMQCLRQSGIDANAPDVTDIVSDAGWHYSCMGGVEALQRKLASFSHAEINVPPFNEAAYLWECMTAPRDFLDRETHKFEFRGIDNTLPQSVINNPGKYEHMFYFPRRRLFNA